MDDFKGSSLASVPRLNREESCGAGWRVPKKGLCIFQVTSVGGSRGVARAEVARSGQMVRSWICFEDGTVRFPDGQHEGLEGGLLASANRRTGWLPAEGGEVLTGHSGGRSGPGSMLSFRCLLEKSESRKGEKQKG